MNTLQLVTPDEIRTRFSTAMSEMYRHEVPQYGALLDLVSDVNQDSLLATPKLAARMLGKGELSRLNVERHGAIRLGTAAELFTMRRIFAVMGMSPVGYYDLSIAGVPVHATAFRPIDDAALLRNPFRMFTSLLRLELIDDVQLRTQAKEILAKRNFYTPRALALTELFEQRRALTTEEADEFVQEVRETFRWHPEATVCKRTYQQLHDTHRLVADVVCFKGPHINHLTPRTLDIDAAQTEMSRRNIGAKEYVEGPPPRHYPILLRQTSFKALEERVRFAGEESSDMGKHTARFGEIEQRGMALTKKGRALYDDLLARALNGDSDEASALEYPKRLQQAFKEFPDDLERIRKEGLAFFHYHAPDIHAARRELGDSRFELDRLVSAGVVQAEPIVYEDFLPVSAAGIFKSNLGGGAQHLYAANAAQSTFEAALGVQILDEIRLYEESEQRSIDLLIAALAEDMPSLI